PAREPARSGAGWAPPGRSGRSAGVQIRSQKREARPESREPALQTALRVRHSTAVKERAEIIPARRTGVRRRKATSCADQRQFAPGLYEQREESLTPVLRRSRGQGNCRRRNRGAQASRRTAARRSGKSSRE